MLINAGFSLFSIPGYTCLRQFYTNDITMADEKLMYDVLRQWINQKSDKAIGIARVTHVTGNCHRVFENTWWTYTSTYTHIHIWNGTANKTMNIPYRDRPAREIRRLYAMQLLSAGASRGCRVQYSISRLRNVSRYQSVTPGINFQIRGFIRMMEEMHKLKAVLR